MNVPFNKFFWLLGGMLVALLGCNDTQYDQKVVLQGKLTKSGQPVTVNNAQMGDYARVEVLFLREGTQDTPIALRVGPDGTFALATDDGNPLPAGKYRVGVRQWEPYPSNDLLQGKFDVAKTPIRVELTNEKKDIVIDIDKPQG